MNDVKITGLTDEQIAEFWNWDISERWVREKVASRIRENGYIVVSEQSWELLRQTRILDEAMIRAHQREAAEQPATPTPSTEQIKAEAWREVLEYIAITYSDIDVAYGVIDQTRAHFAALVSPVSEQPTPERDPDYDAGVYFCGDCGKRSSMYGHQGKCPPEQGGDR